MDAARLKSIPLFASLDKSELEQVARWTDEVEVPGGTKLTKQDGFAHEFAIIEEGTADVLKDGDKIAELGPGDFFGEIGLLETERRTASVVATAPMRLVVMFGRDFRQMEREMPSLADRIRSVMEERLARA